MLNKILRLAPALSAFVFFASQLGGCSGDDPAAPAASCSGTAPCANGQTCTNGVCVAPQTPLAGAAGTASGTAGSGTNNGGSNSSTSAGAGGSANAAGASLGGAAGSVAMAGQGGAQAGTGSGGSTSGGDMSGAGTGGVVNPITVGQCKDDYWPPANSGSVTRYDFKQLPTTLPACANVITHSGNGSDGDWDTVEGISTGDGGFFGAMNTTDFAQGAACGACVEASYNGKKVVLTIVDECPIGSNPVCTKGHIDLSRKAIRQLESNSSLENLKNVSWKYVKCPVSGNAKVRLHPNQNPNWQPIVIENGLYPLKSVTLNGANATRVGNAAGGNAWIAAPQKPPYLVKATDVNNNAITFNYAVDSGLKDIGLQFMCQ